MSRERAYQPSLATAVPAYQSRPAITFSRQYHFAVMRTASLFAFLLVFALSASAQTGVSGVVKDSTGGVVAGAAVIARGPSGSEQQTVTGPDGRFSFGSVPSGARIVVRASGFAEKTQPAEGSLEVELAPATLLESVSVTATRTEQRLADVPA